MAPLFLEQEIQSKANTSYRGFLRERWRCRQYREKQHDINPPPSLTCRVCVLNTESPIFACLPRVEGAPITLVPTSTGATAAGSGNGTGVHQGDDWWGSPCIEGYNGYLSVRGLASAAPSATVARTYWSKCGRWAHCFFFVIMFLSSNSV